MFVDSDQVYQFQVETAGLSDRLFFTTAGDLGSISTCRSYDSNFMHDCYDLSPASCSTSSLDSSADSCSINLDFAKRSSSSSSNTFNFNKRTQQKFFPGVDVPYTECVNQSTTSFVKEDVRQSLEAWLKSMKQPSVDPFWSLEPSEEPLDPANPTLDISLHSYRRRHSYMHEPMMVRSSNRILHLGPMINGRVQGRINDSLVDASDWKAPVFMLPARSPEAYDNLDLQRGGGNQANSDLSLIHI